MSLIPKIYTNTISPFLFECFCKIGDIEELKHCRLVGGTALSLLLGHRLSVDLDLFTDQEYGTLNFLSVNKKLNDLFKYVETFDIRSNEIGKMFYVGNSETEAIKLDIFYTDPFISEGIFIGGNLPIASLYDVIPMKIDAVINRGSMKDFWDLHEILEHFSFKDIIGLYEQKYPYKSIEKKEIDSIYFNLENDYYDNIKCLKGKYWELIKYDIQCELNDFFNQINKRRL